MAGNAAVGRSAHLKPFYFMRYPTMPALHFKSDKPEISDSTYCVEKRRTIKMNKC